MYQFMVATTRSGTSWTGNRQVDSTGADVVAEEFTTMSSLTSGTNKWASRVVVALQLAAWSAVGIVLLEKGISSLQKTQRPIEHSLSNRSSQLPEVTGQKVTNSGGISSETITPPEDVLSVIPVSAEDDYSKENGITTAGMESFSVAVGEANTERTDELTSTEQPRLLPDVRIDGASSREKMNASKKINDLEDRFNGLKTSGNKPDGKAKESVEDRRSSIDKSLPENVNTQEGGEKNVENKTQSIPRAEEASTSGRKRLKIGPANGSGAAAAVAMVAVGAVMLVLGPAVIVLRALDERRQERRFLKLSGEEDLPPSYEQATGSIEQAPTYSSLNLDSIANTQSSSRPTENTTS